MTRLEKLKELEDMLHRSIYEADEKALAPLVKQYRETIREIEEIEGGVREDDEIGEILAKRGANGEPIPNRKNRTAVSKQRRT